MGKKTLLEVSKSLEKINMAINDSPAPEAGNLAGGKDI